ncbi:GIY-YIG nuclease family protein [Thermococcus sp.]
MKGSYLLVIWLDEDKMIRTKAREFSLRRGYYVYVGSAMNSLEGRVRRHFSPKKKLHWHIDYLLKEAELLEAYLIPNEKRLEETLSLEISKIAEPVVGFGASDVSVGTNLYHFSRKPDPFLEAVLKELNLEWKRVKSINELEELMQKNLKN